MIDTARLIACGVLPTQARVWAGLLAATCRRFGISTTEQQAGFVAQALHESEKLTHLEESLYYRKPDGIRSAFCRLQSMSDEALWLLCSSPLKNNSERLANVAYAGINGNGDGTTGDGWRFRGGCPFQLTGRDNYRRSGEYLQRPLEQGPDLIRVASQDSADAAGWFWHDKGLNSIADIDVISRKVNGGTNGLAERRSLYRTALIALA